MKGVVAPSGQLVADQVQVRSHGEPSGRTLVYLPGLHGNWTLVGNFRNALNGRVHFVEVSYPPSLTWNLDDYSAGVEKALAQHGTTGGWLLAESFSSLVAWTMISRKVFRAEGLILAGGFVRHPAVWGARLAETIARDISFSLLLHILFGYAKISRLRFRKSPETQRGIEEFIAHLTEEERHAAKHRLHLVANNDPSAIAREATLPVYAVTGLFDPIVPWYWVRRWLKKNCPALREYRIIASADHNVLGTGATLAANHVIRWIGAGAAS